VNRAGFTLVELIVAITIMAILAGVVAFAASHAIPPRTDEAVGTYMLDSAADDGRIHVRRSTDSAGTIIWTSYLPDGRVLRGMLFRDRGTDEAE
jgi:prepilin-type N-terminal cleavage/methylation domain-containing protein